MSRNQDSAAAGIFGFIAVAWLAYFAFRILWAVFGPALEGLA